MMKLMKPAMSSRSCLFLVGLALILRPLILFVRFFSSSSSSFSSSFHEDNGGEQVVCDREIDSISAITSLMTLSNPLKQPQPQREEQPASSPFSDEPCVDLFGCSDGSCWMTYRLLTLFSFLLRLCLMILSAFRFCCSAFPLSVLQSLLVLAGLSLRIHQRFSKKQNEQIPTTVSQSKSENQTIEAKQIYQKAETRPRRARDERKLYHTTKTPGSTKTRTQY